MWIMLGARAAGPHEIGWLARDAHAAADRVTIGA